MEKSMVPCLGKETKKVRLKILSIIESKDVFKTTTDVGGNLPPKGLPITCISC